LAVEETNQAPGTLHDEKMKSNSDWKSGVGKRLVGAKLANEKLSSRKHWRRMK
jgi:hypothetical protein